MRIGVVRWRALGTTVELLVGAPTSLPPAREAVRRELDAIDRACSRFRDDSELSRLNAAAGTGPVPVGPLLLEALAVALAAAERTDGAVDPTIGASMVAAGYDRDFDRLSDDPRPFAPRPAAGWRGVLLDLDGGAVTLPAGTALDLGATAKGLAADRAARAASAATHADSVLVSLGGDVAVAGAIPDAGWPVGIAADHRDADPPTVVAIRGGGVATSGVTGRRWRRGGRDLHHVLDPRSGEPVDAGWRTASVAASSCATAEAYATAALVWGADAPRRLERAGVAARLVADDGAVTVAGGWPRDAERPTTAGWAA